MNLNFNQCLTLLIIGFIFALIVCRALLAVVNRLFLVIEHAKKELLGRAQGGGKFNLLGELWGLGRPIITQKFNEWIGGKHP